MGLQVAGRTIPSQRALRMTTTNEQVANESSHMAALSLHLVKAAVDDRDLVSTLMEHGSW
jgi:hypothetical protein